MGLQKTKESQWGDRSLNEALFVKAVASNNNGLLRSERLCVG